MPEMTAVADRLTSAPSAVASTAVVPAGGSGIAGAAGAGSIGSRVTSPCATSWLKLARPLGDRDLFNTGPGPDAGGSKPGR